MKKITMLFTGTIFLAAVLAFSSFTSLPPGPSANGQGTLTLLPGDQTRHFSFHANTMPDGSVQGNGVLTYTGGVLKITFDIDCLIVSGNTASMTGVITRHDQNPAFVGTRCRFKVEDNGEGANASGDRITLLNVGLPATFPCLTVALALNPIEGGNIQVKP